MCHGASFFGKRLFQLETQTEPLVVPEIEIRWKLSRLSRFCVVINEQITRKSFPRLTRNKFLLRKTAKQTEAAPSVDGTTTGAMINFYNFISLALFPAQATKQSWNVGEEISPLSLATPLLPLSIPLESSKSMENYKFMTSQVTTTNDCTKCNCFSTFSAYEKASPRAPLEILVTVKLRRS